MVLLGSSPVGRVDLLGTRFMRKSKNTVEILHTIASIHSFTLIQISAESLWRSSILPQALSRERHEQLTA